MPKPIVLTQDIIDQVRSEVMSQLQKAKLSDGKFSYTKTFVYSDDHSRVRVLYSPLAYAKTILLLNYSDQEIAWHGFVERLDRSTFLITDIAVYPQEVSSATVQTDQERYQRWIMNIGDDRANTMLMQGHSHVRMSPSPSGVDLRHQEQIVSQLLGNSFYIFTIWNKHLQHHTKVYDLATNTLFENDDIDVGVDFSGSGSEAFLAEIDQLVSHKDFASPCKQPCADILPSDQKRSRKRKYSLERNIQPDYDEMIFGSLPIDDY